MLKYAGLVLAPMLVLLTGCPPPHPPGVAPRSEQQPLARVNDNLSQIGAPVRYSGFASFSFRDAEGKQRGFRWQEAVLIFRKAHDLRFDIRSPTGTLAQFGSNDERFWLWVEPEAHKLWWGRWRNPGVTSRLPLPANDLIDSLMLRPLPTTQANGSQPALRHTGQDYYLVYERPDGGAREIQLDCRPPYQPVEIVDRLPDNRIQMRSTLSNYRRIGADGPYTPHRYVICWPIDDAEMRLDVRRAVFRPELPPEAFAFPAGWQGEVEDLDEAAE
jgi:hypothetical protein